DGPVRESQEEDEPRSSLLGSSRLSSGPRWRTSRSIRDDSRVRPRYNLVIGAAERKHRLRPARNAAMPQDETDGQPARVHEGVLARMAPTGGERNLTARLLRVGVGLLAGLVAVVAAGSAQQAAISLAVGAAQPAEVSVLT